MRNIKPYGAKCLGKTSTTRLTRNVINDSTIDAIRNTVVAGNRS